MAVATHDLASLLWRSIAEHRSDLAVVCDGGSLSYGELGERASRLAAAARSHGLATGDRVLVLLGNRLEYPEIDVGLAFAGLVRVALNVRLAYTEHAHAARDSGARMLITEEGFDEVAAALASEFDLAWLRIGASDRPDGARAYELALAQADSTPVVAASQRSADPVWISYTSGTTGRPKGVVLSDQALVNVIFNIMLELGPIGPGRAILLSQPLSHGAGYFVLPYLISGGVVHIATRFDPEQTVWLGRKHHIGTFKCVPTMIGDLLDLDIDLPFRSVIYGAAPMALPQVERSLDRWGPVLIQLYGQSEAPITITVLHKADFVRLGSHRASAGRPWRTVDVTVRAPDGQVMPTGELGEVVVRGTHLMTGYLGQPETTREVLRDGHVWTRDAAIRDEDGYIYLRGRRDEMIISGGFNISPKEIEDVIAAHPAVREVIAVGRPDERLGEAVEVHVVLAENASVNEDELIAFSRPHLGFRRPRSVVFIDEVPRSAYGKVDRKAHAALVAEQRRRDIDEVVG